MILANTDNRIVKASFRDCPLNDRKLFKQSHCLLPISVGQPVHEGKKLIATLKLINASFNKCTILIGDTLQRHNLQFSLGLSEDEARKKSKELGDAWLERNSFLITENLKITHFISRWNEWLDCSGFAERFTAVENLYLKNNNFRLSLDYTVHEYIQRNSLDDTEKAEELCLTYLKEECAIFPVWAEAHYDFEVYPSGRNEAMKAAYDYLVKPQNPLFLKPVALRFKKYPSQSAFPNQPCKGLESLIL